MHANKKFNLHELYRTQVPFTSKDAYALIFEFINISAKCHRSISSQNINILFAYSFSPAIFFSTTDEFTQQL